MGRFCLREPELDYLYDFLLFFAKSFTLVLVCVAGIIAILLVAARQKARRGQLEFEDLSADYRQTCEQLQAQLLSPDALKQRAREQKQEAKARKKQALASVEPRLFVIDFKGGVEAKEVASLREEVTAILAVARQDDEVLVRVESGGGVVHGYGLCASQLQRIRARGLRLTVAIDKVAASGGYMMACVAQHIMAAPFAIVGSIGVVAQLPNFHRLLQKHDIDFEQHTAGQYKRTLTLFGENDDAGREKFRAELESVHQQFKQFVGQHRPRVDLTAVATGEHWLASEALAFNLVDELKTSDDYLQENYAQRQVVRLKFKQPKRLGERLAGQASTLLTDSVINVWQRLRTPFHD